MAKLTLLAITFAAMVAFATAHATIITTTIEDENPSSKECRQRLKEQEFNQCESYLQEGQMPYEEMLQGLRRCCKELENVDEQCQCEAMKKVYQDVKSQQQHQRHQGGEYDSKEIEELKHKAQNLPKQCRLKTRRCEIGTMMTTTTTTVTVTEGTIGNPFWLLGSKQCSKREVQGRVNQCQRYVEEQISGGPRTLLMSINKREEEEKEQQGLQECCSELQHMRKECQCEAMKEVVRKAKQQVGEYGKQEEQMQVVRHVVQNLPNQCRLDVQKCHIPYEMF